MTIKYIFKRSIAIVGEIYYSLLFGRFGKYSIVRGHLTTSSPKNIYIGEGCDIGPYSRLETYPCYGNRKTQPVLTIGDNSSLQHAVHVYCVKKLTIGKGALIASGCMITDNDHGTDPEGDLYVRQPLTPSPTQIEDYVWLGENVCVLSGSHIGERSIIGANSVVKGSIPAYSIAVGNPAKVIKQYNFETKSWEKKR